MKTCYSLLPILLLFWACSEEYIELPDHGSLLVNGSQEAMPAHNEAHIKPLQKVEVITFQPAGGFGGAGNVLNEGDVFPPGHNSFALLTRAKDNLKFNIHTTGLPEGAYTVWWVIFNDPGDCNEPNGAGGLCGGAGPNDLFLPTTSVIWATGGIVQSNGIGNFRNRLNVGEERDETIILGADLSSALQYPLTAEVHLIIKYHGLASSDPEVLYAQTHTLLGNCDGNSGANSYDLPPPFGPYQCFDPQVAIFPSEIEPI